MLWEEVAAFIGPLIIAIGLLGGLISWLVNRTTKFVQGQISDVQNLTNERIKVLTDQLIEQNKILSRLQEQQMTTATSVARIEGRLSAGNPSHPSGPV